MRVLLTDDYLGDPDLEQTELSRVGAELIRAPSTDSQTLTACAVDADAILACAARVPAAVFEHAPRLRIVCRYGIGVDTIDVDAATRHGIMVCNVPDYCVDEVATHAIALILDLVRHITYYHQQVRERIWQWRTPRPIKRLAGQVVGILGLGRIGSMVAKKLRSFGVTIVGHDPAVSPAQAAAMGVTFLSMEELLARVDVLTLHVPLMESTRGLIGESEIARMKHSAYLINTSRGAVVDERALISALQHGHLAGAGVDVFETEPLPSSYPLLNCPNVILTPHAAWYSEEAAAEARRKAVQTVITGLHGGVPAALINREVLSR